MKTFKKTYAHIDKTNIYIQRKFFLKKSHGVYIILKNKDCHLKGNSIGRITIYYMIGKRINKVLANITLNLQIKFTFKKTILHIYSF
jgi:hypothetical protein